MLVVTLTLSLPLNVNAQQRRANARTQTKQKQSDRTQQGKRILAEKKLEAGKAQGNRSIKVLQINDLQNP
jgi:hypothetical protein